MPDPAPQTQQPPYYRNWGASSSLFSNAPPPQPGLFGMSPADMGRAGVGGALLQTAAPLISEWARTEFGMFGFTFGSGLNPATTEYGREYLQQMDAGRRAGSLADQAALDRASRGLAMMMGHRPDMDATRAAGDGRVQFSPAVERARATIVSNSAAMLPILARAFPDAVDAALPGGSMTVAADHINNANRFQIDPTTGRRLSEDSGFTARVLNPLAAAGAEATDGLRIGRVGATYAELSQRGIIGSGERQLTREAYDNFRGRSDPNDRDAPQLTEGRAREINADRVRQQLSGYAKSIAAINEIFAENGRTNAPMGELVEALDKLTQGGFSMYGATQLTQLARSYQGASQEFGLTLAGAQALSTGAGAQLAAVGAHRGLALPTALYAAAAGNAYGQRGYAIGPETGSREDQMAMTVARQAAGAGSEVGNLMGALEVQSRYLGEAGAATDLGKVVAAMRRGEVTTTLNDGSTFDLRTANHDQITGLATRSGLSGQSILNQIARGRSENMAALTTPENQAGFAATVQVMQQSEAERFFLSRSEGQLTTALGGRANNRQFFDAVYEAANRADLTTTQQVTAAVGARLGITDPNQLAIIGPLISEVGTEWARTAGIPDAGGIAGIRNMSPQYRQAAGVAQTRADAAGRRAAALARLNPQTALSGMSDAVARAGELATHGGFVRDDGTIDFGRFAATAGLGGVDLEAAMRALGQDGRGGVGGGRAAGIGGGSFDPDREARNAFNGVPGAGFGGPRPGGVPGGGVPGGGVPGGGVPGGGVPGGGVPGGAGAGAGAGTSGIGGGFGSQALRVPIPNDGRPPGAGGFGAGGFGMGGRSTEPLRGPFGQPTGGNPQGMNGGTMRLSGEITIVDNGQIRVGRPTDMIGETTPPPGGR